MEYSRRRQAAQRSGAPSTEVRLGASVVSLPPRVEPGQPEKDACGEAQVLEYFGRWALCLIRRRALLRNRFAAVVTSSANIP